MKTDKIMIGDLARCVNFEKERKYEPETFYSECQDGHLRISTSTLNYKTLKENVLFIENEQGQLVHHFRKYSKVPSAEGEIYAENLHPGHPDVLHVRGAGYRYVWTRGALYR